MVAGLLNQAINSYCVLLLVDFDRALLFCHTIEGVRLVQLRFDMMLFVGLMNLRGQREQLVE
ncbi:MAG: hypothetical protein CTR53_07355 [Ferrovibrio sp.]|nr:MAG: hypothetical protein CTR53_07355 [Ferrovibrio sp.]